MYKRRKNTPEIEKELILAINHPNQLIQDNLADIFIFYKHHGIYFKRKLEFIFKKPLNYLQKVIKLIIHFFVNLF
ncbi:MAG: hypothetical protein JJ845_001655 [Prochlorococcus marinus CUG1436]|nr:hypothetical protein [Prochlorococcus marinus CUG1436]